jgi:malonyl-CoA O-methyltransferase
VFAKLRERLPGFSDTRSSLQKAIDWVKKHRIENSGIVVHHKTNNVTPEVTGYLIPSMYNAGEKEFAYELAKWEASVQQPNGSFLAPDGVPYTFDTAQVIRGFLAVLNDMPQIETNLRRACDYIESQIDGKGEIHTPSYGTWKLSDGSIFSQYCHLYVLPPLQEAGKQLGEPKYEEAVRRGLNYFKQQPDLTEFKSEMGTISHIYGYMMEALVELGETELARKGIAKAMAIQREDGAIPAYPGVDWICSTGIAQLAIACHNLGEVKAASKALGYLKKIQNPSGGFFGSYGSGAKYFPKEEISWACKYFIDLHLLTRQ